MLSPCYQALIKNNISRNTFSTKTILCCFTYGRCNFPVIQVKITADPVYCWPTIYASFRTKTWINLKYSFIYQRESLLNSQREQFFLKVATIYKAFEPLRTFSPTSAIGSFEIFALNRNSHTTGTRFEETLQKIDIFRLCFKSASCPVS